MKYIISLLKVHPYFWVKMISISVFFFYFFLIFLFWGKGGLVLYIDVFVDNRSFIESPMPMN